jgi:acetolactate synthase I/II/III large subunit
VIRVADYIARRLADFGVQHVFLLTGGGAMHLNDAIGKEKRIHYICNHHEQACAMAAEAYAKVTGGLSVINVTTGPGGINALNGVFGAWTDSIPMLVLSGQVKRETCMSTYNIPGLRQIGEQEANLLPMVSGITKYSATIHDPKSIRYHLEKALHLAFTPRMGPVWLELPVDVQGAKVDETELPGYDYPAEDQNNWDIPQIEKQCAEVLERIRRAKRPVVLVGSGVRLSKTQSQMEEFIGRIGAPVVPSRSAHDLIVPAHPLFSGWPGIDCDRPGNWTVQNSDLLLVLGSSLGIRLVSYNWKAFARCAYKIQVDVDTAVLQKPTVRPDMSIHADLAVFLPIMNRLVGSSGYDCSVNADWLAWCRERVARYPALRPEQREYNGHINPYHFMDVLFECLEKDDCIVCANGTAYQVPLQVGKLKQGQQFIFNNGCMSMGYDLPAAVGAAVARKGRRVICLAGEGSIQLNVQELQTIMHYRLPVKIFVISNQGYLSIRLTQGSFFGDLMGEGPQTGVSFPDMLKLGQAYGYPSVRIDGPDFERDIRRVLDEPGPALAEVVVDPKQGFEPKVASRQLPDGRIISVPPEDMFPFLDREEFARNLLMPEMETEGL